MKEFFDTYGKFFDTIQHEQGGEMEIKLNIDSEQPFEIWLNFKSGTKTNVTMTVQGVKELMQKLNCLVSAYEEITKKS
jgi:hypothetical protein